MTEFSDRSRVANLIIAGVNKAGSTSLFHYLSSHPQVCGSRDKETCYFLPLLYNGEVAPVSEYEAQFSHCSGNVTYRMEATPAYFYGGRNMASHISASLGDVRIMIILKDPVERLVSFYQRKKTTFQLPSGMTLKDYVNQCLAISGDEILSEENKLFTGIYFGEYHHHLPAWFDVYGSRLKLLFFDDLKKDSRRFMSDISSWLGIDERFYDTYSFDVMNKSHDYKNGILHRAAVAANNAGKRFWRSNPGIKKALMGIYYKLNGTPVQKPGADDETITFLRNYYKPHNEKLRFILEQNGITTLPSWLNAKSPVTA